MATHCKLSVNVNKVALIRNQRIGNFPDPVLFAQRCEEWGAEGITVHPRPDERHIRYSDIPRFKERVQTEFNIEGYPSSRFLEMVLQTKPTQCTLVPDAADVLTSDSGWDIPSHYDMLGNVVSQLQAARIRVSLFIDPDPIQVEWASKLGVERVELYTGDYAKYYSEDKVNAILPHVIAAQSADKQGVGLNAGHDLNLSNLAYYSSRIQNLLEVSIGHAIVVDALYMGMREAIRSYQGKLSVKE